MTSSRVLSCLFVAPVLALVSGAAVLSQHTPAAAAQGPVGLGTAGSYAVLAGSTVTNTGPSVISGDVGVSPGTAVTGFPPGTVANGSIHSADAVTAQAADDLVTAYDDAAGRGPVVDKTGQDLAGQTLQAGVYGAAGAMALTGTVTLDAAGDPAAVFVLQAGSTLITASDSTVALVNGAQACNVYWQVGSSATLGTGTDFVGNVLALTSITAQTGADVQGRLLARNGQVSLDTNTITRASCAAPTDPTSTATVSPSDPSTPTTSDSPSTVPPSTVPTTVPPVAPGGPGAPSGPTTPVDSGGPLPTPTPDTPVSSPPGGAGPGPSTPPADTSTAAPPYIPPGNPGTGRTSAVQVEAVASSSTTGQVWLLLGLAALIAAAGTAVLSSRNAIVPSGRHRA
ncbi:MAG: hypothetical protein JWN84_3723 [Nocardioides sp.]|nr:hypothetical protein [Nocardioides sp.]